MVELNSILIRPLASEMISERPILRHSYFSGMLSIASEWFSVAVDVPFVSSIKVKVKFITCKFFAIYVPSPESLIRSLLEEGKRSLFLSCSIALVLACEASFVGHLLFHLE